MLPWEMKTKREMHQKDLWIQLACHSLQNPIRVKDHIYQHQQPKKEQLSRPARRRA
jgi:hypothetical protein